MDIAALSMALSQMNTRTEASVSLVKKSMNQSEADGHAIVRMMEQSVQPHVGGRVDLKL